MQNNKSVLIRRIIAIVCMLCTVAFMFWPTYYGLVSERERFGGKIDTRETFESFWAYRSNITKNLESSVNRYGKMPSWGASVIVLNIAFFVLLALAVASIVLMLLNQTRIPAIVHTALSVLTAVGVAAYWIISAKAESRGVYTVRFVPGATMFLIPVFSLAASIVYQRKKREKQV